MSNTRSGLLRLRSNPDPKSWRPHTLALSGSPRNRWSLIEPASASIHNQAPMTVYTVLPNPSAEVDTKREPEGAIRDVLGSRWVQSLVRTRTAEDPFEGGSSNTVELAPSCPTPSCSGTPRIQPTTTGSAT